MRVRVLAVLALAAALSLPALPAASATELLSQGRPVSASSEESVDYTPARAAVDGSPTTRWASRWTDDQWLQVDLGASVRVDRVELSWEAAYATAYEIQLADSPTGPWRTVHTERAGDGGQDRVPVSGTGRHVRLQGIQRAGGYGYSLWEFQVYGEPGPAGPAPTPTPTPTPDGPLTRPSVVKVTGGNGSWQLEVDGRPYAVKGFTWGPKFGEAGQYLPGFTAMGANTTRTWGTGADTKELLDAPPLRVSG